MSTSKGDTCRSARKGHLDKKISTALATRRKLGFVYNNENRIIHPYGLLARGGYWYLVGFDELRAAQRIFRIDRIEGNVTVVEPKSASLPDGFCLARAVTSAYELLNVDVIL